MDHTRAAVAALTAAAAAEHDFAGWLAAVLARAAANAGGTAALTEGRPGSWESAALAALLEGTAGRDGEYLPEPDPPCGHARPDRAAQKAVLAVTAAVLDADPGAAAAAAGAAPCPECATVAAAQFAVAVAAEVFAAAVAMATGQQQQQGPGIPPELHAALESVVAAARRELDAGAN